MNRQLVENILAVIKTSSDKAVIIKGLVKLRTDVVKDKDGILLFRDAGGVTPMVRFLSKPHEQILEVALSIMGNCCTDETSCKEALESKIAVPLATILKSIPNPIIQCRACRLLGNLAKVDANQSVINYCPTIAQALCRIIEETSDVQTRIMAFRASRFLLSNLQFLKNFLQAGGFSTLLRILASVMKNNDYVVEEKLLNDAQAPLKMGLKRNQHREKYFEEVARNLEGVRSDIFDHEMLKNSTRNSQVYAMPKEKAAVDLVCEILKCLLGISELQVSVSIWESLNRFNCTFSPIVYFVTEENNKHRSAALKILSNISKNPGAFYILSSAGAILAACELLVTTDPQWAPNESESRHCINIISILSIDACNRSKIRRSGALRKLIALCKESISHSEKSTILNVLINFQYDNMSMDLMLCEGLINVLIKELNLYLTSDDEYYKRKREEKLQSSKKRKLQEVPNETKCKVKEEIYPDCDSPSSSPRSYNAPSSPCSSRSMSPVGGNICKTNDSDEESYSPVCSDEEEEDDEKDETTEADTSSYLYSNPNANCSDHNIIMNLLDVAARSEQIEDNILLDKEDDEEISQDAALKLPPNSNLRHNTIDIIDNLIFRITCLVKKSSDLGKPETMITLIKAINLFGINLDFAGSLTNILLESQFFGQVIKQGICHQLFQLTKIPEMAKEGFGFLDTLTSVGESNYGKEELARLLRSEDICAQKRAAITVSYIIRSKILLYQFLNDGNALAVLLDIILSSKQDEFTAEAVDSLTCMARFTLGIDIPQTAADKRLDEYDVYVEKDVDHPLHDTCDMRFIVHDPNLGEDSKESVIAVAFNKALLCATSEVFNTMLNSNFREGNEGEVHLRTNTVSGLLYFLNLIVRQSENLKMNIPPVEKYYVLLEAFEMSRIYIIPEIEQFVLQVLISQLDESNCLRLFDWSMKNYHVQLTEMSINYYLCSSLTTEAKVNLFRTAESAEWFQMIIETVLSRCRNVF